MKAVVRDAYWYFTTYYTTDRYQNGSVASKVFGMGLNLLMFVLKRLNMTFIHVPTPEGFEIENGLTDNLIRAMIAKEGYIALGEVGTNYLIETFVDFTNSYYTLSLH